MEPVFHTCGQPIARQESGGAARVVLYSQPAANGLEIHACPGCDQILSDADLYSVTFEERAAHATAIDGRSRLVFPFHWRERGRAYTYASVDRPTPRVEVFASEIWQPTGKIDLDTFQRWMAVLESVEAS